MSLLTPTLKWSIPRRTSRPDPIVHAKFFTPDGSATWLVTEYDGVDEFFGYACLGDHEMAELGYFSRAELETLRGPLGLPVERDEHWKPIPLSLAMKTLCGGAHK